jgi:hypothetical protein
MLTASTDERREFILYDATDGSQAYPLAGLKYLDTDGVKKWAEDITSISVSKGNRNKQYGKFLLVPPVFTLSAAMNNKGEIYSPGGALENLLSINRKLYPYFGYMTDTAADATKSFMLADAVQFYHTVVSGVTIISSASNVSPALTAFRNLPGITDSWTLYDSGTYDDGYYAPAGYYESSILRIRDMYYGSLPKQITVTSTTTKVDVYYRIAFRKENIQNNVTNFVLLGTCAVGANTWTFPTVSNERYIQLAFVFRDSTYGESAVSAPGLVYNNYSELFEQGEYLLDVPSFSSKYSGYSASFSGRNNLKKALETKISTPTIASPTDISTIIRNIATRCKIAWTATTIPMTTYTVSSAAGYANVKALDAFEECLQYLNTFADYRLWLDTNGNLTLGIKETDYTSADWVINYRYNAKTLGKQKTADMLLQRITISNAALTLAAETQLATANYTTTGSKTLSWAQPNMCKRFEIVVNSGDAVVTYVSNTTTQMIFTIAGTTIDVDITVHGCQVSSPPSSYGEEFMQGNFEDGVGMTYELVNRYLTGAYSATLAARYVAEYGTPQYTVSVEIPLNPLLELNDRVLILEKNTNTKTIYVIESISHKFSANGASASTNLTLRDIGFTYASYVYDRGQIVGLTDMLYDNGFVYDYDIWPAEDDSLYPHDVDCA